MNYVKLAAVSLNQTPLDWSGNSSRLREAIAECRNAGAELICLPELAITGYGCEDQFLAPSTCDQALNRLARLLPETRDLVVAVGLPLQHQNAVYNVVALISDGRLLGFYAKQNLAGDGIHYEQRWFRAWPTGQVARIDILGETVPLGDVTFEVGGRRIGFEVCEDAWVANRPGRNYSKVGIDIILNPSASHFAFGKHRIREQFACEGSRAFGAAYVYANLLGNESGRVIFDGGSLIASGGELLAGAPRLSFKEIEIITAPVNLDLNRLNQARTMSREVDPLATCTVTTPHTWTGCAPGKNIGPAPELSKEEEFTLAVCLGLFDYMRKSHSNGFIVSLSGGADSAAVASLVFLMYHLALEELGEETFLSRLPQFKGAINMSDLLLCAYQATKNSGEVTQNAAAELAEALGADYAEWDVQPAVDHYIQLAESTAGRTLNWEEDDITLQNIQARVRAPGIWMQANLRNALLLSTSNRSEAAVGYATMDGDTCGGLCPIAGIDKAFLRHWLNWLEKKGSDRIPKVPSLAAVNNQKPTAELRPEDQGQTDEDDLMPYPVLDLIERLAIRDKQAPAEILQLLQSRFDDHDFETIRNWVIRFFRLWSRNQWKRERYAPGFHLDDENLDPKTWCRFPILSGGFEDELKAL